MPLEVQGLTPILRCNNLATACAAAGEQDPGQQIGAKPPTSEFSQNEEAAEVEVEDHSGLPSKAVLPAGDKEIPSQLDP